MFKKIFLLLTIFCFITVSLYAADLHQAFFLTTMTEQEIEGVIEKFPNLGEKVRNWRVIATINDEIVVHVIADTSVFDRLSQREEYLGKSYREIAQKAKAGDPDCQKVLKQIVLTSWEIDNPEYPEEGSEKIIHHGSLGEWLLAGRPERLSGWRVIHQWFNHSLEVPESVE